MTDIVICAICGRSFDIDAEGGFRSATTGNCICDGCCKDNRDGSITLTPPREAESRRG